MRAPSLMARGSGPEAPARGRSHSLRRLAAIACPTDALRDMNCSVPQAALRGNTTGRALLPGEAMPLKAPPRRHVDVQYCGGTPWGGAVIEFGGVGGFVFAVLATQSFVQGGGGLWGDPPHRTP